MNSFCLGIRTGGCMGLRLDRTTKGTQSWVKIRGELATMWGESWTNNIIPAGDMRTGSNMGPFAMFELSPTTRFRMQAKGKLSMGGSLNFLPSFDITTNLSP